MENIERVCFVFLGPDRQTVSNPSSSEDAILEATHAETILVEEGRHLIRTADRPQETEDPTDMAGPRIRQVQQLQEIADTVGTHMGGTHAHRAKWGKKIVAAANRAHKLVRPVEERKQIRAPNLQLPTSLSLLKEINKEVISAQLSSN